MYRKTKKRTMTLDWVKLQVKLIDDERICELVAQKGMAGFGVYMWIICLMYQRSSHCFTKTQLKTMKLPGATSKTVNQVVNDFGLFRCDEYGHVYSVIDFFRLGAGDEQDDHADATPSQDPSSSTPARINKGRDKNKNIKNNHHLIDDGGDGNSVSSEENLEAIISQFPREGQWVDVVAERSGFRQLLLRQWDEALQHFRRHVVSNCKVNEVRSLEDAKRYFMFYVANAITGSRLQKDLTQYEKWQRAESVYRYEDINSAPGHRSYNGFPLPDYAPPRPDVQADWDYEDECWVTPFHPMSQ